MKHFIRKRSFPIHNIVDPVVKRTFLSFQSTLNDLIRDYNKALDEVEELKKKVANMEGRA